MARVRSNDSNRRSRICDIWPTEKMPVDQWGNRADLIMDGISVVKRLNQGQLFEHYINSSRMMMERHIKEMFHNKPIKTTWEYLFNWYKIVSPRFAEIIKTVLNTDELIKAHLENILLDGIYLWIPPDSDNLGPGQVSLVRNGLEKSYTLEISPITYTDVEGTTWTTEDPIIIGSKYIMLLEAIPEKCSAVSTANLQHFGLPALLSNKDKYSLPVRQQPVKIFGETEIRLLLSTVGPDAVAELLDRTNSPATLRNMVRNIMEAEQPTNIENAVNRQEAPRGKSRPLVYINHELACAGIELQYSEYKHEED